MGNATDALKSRGYRATGTNDEGGLATPSGDARSPGRRPMARRRDKRGPANHR